MINRMEYTNDLSSVDMKVSQFYQTCMGLEYVEQEGEKPLKRIIQQLGKTYHSLSHVTFQGHSSHSHEKWQKLSEL